MVYGNSINAGCKGYSLSALLQTSVALVINNTLKGNDLISKAPLHFVCCGDLAVEVILTKLLSDLKFEHVATHYVTQSLQVSKFPNSKRR
jgi:hypothetical protein